MRARLIAVLLVIALVVGVAILLTSGGGGTGTTTSAPVTTVAAPTLAPTTIASPPSTTATALPPTTTQAPTTTGTTAAGSSLPDGCFLIDDARGVLVATSGGEERDVGVILDADTGEPPQGAGPDAPSQVEAMAHDPATDSYFVTSWGLLGRLDMETATFTEVAETGLGDVDGLAFDADGTLYAVSRMAGAPDRLLTVDPETGRVEVVGPVAGPGVLEDVDDLAFEPGSGDLYAITNNEGDEERTSVLVLVDPGDGSAAAVGTNLGVTDAEGLTFGADGRLWVSTGARGSSALFLADPDTGTTEGVAVLGDGFGDYEAMSCPNGA